jgi:hypothetical protein
MMDVRMQEDSELNKVLRHCVAQDDNRWFFQERSGITISFTSLGYRYAASSIINDAALSS